LDAAEEESMPVEPQIASITRDQAVDALRRELIALSDEEHSACAVAAEQRVFCTGFRRWDTSDLRERYWWIVRRRPDIRREELEAIANDWQLAQQEVHDLPLACDVQTKLHDTCRGWHDFTNEELALYYRQMTGQAVRVT
jgi:hypothetical protein